jgi:hypothetical protein
VRIQPWLFAWCAVLLGACGGSETYPVNGGEGEGEGDDPCANQRVGDRRFGVMPGTCGGTTDACPDAQAPSGCNVRPRSTCTAPPGGATVLDVCSTCTYTTISDAVAAIPAVPLSPYWVSVHAGTYTDNVSVTQASTATNTITVAARCTGGSRDAVTVDYSADLPVLQASASSGYVTFEGFVVHASPVSAGFGTVALFGPNGTARDIVVSGADGEAGFYVEGSDSQFSEIDASDCLYGLQELFASGVSVERGAFCGSLDSGMLFDAGSGNHVNATLVQDSANWGIAVGTLSPESDLTIERVWTRGQTAPAGGGLDIWDMNGLDVRHSQISANTFGVSIDLGATDLEFENVLFDRNDRAIEVNSSYLGGDQLRVRYSTFADGTYGMRLLAPIDVRLHDNIFYAGSVPGGYGIDIADASVVIGEKDHNLFYGNYGPGQQCFDEASSGQCPGVIWSSSDPFELGDGYYLEQSRSAAVDAATDASGSTFGDGTQINNYTTALDLVLDNGQADLGFHHPPCDEQGADRGCGDGYCAGGETAATCPRDCP